MRSGRLTAATILLAASAYADPGPSVQVSELSGPEARLYANAHRVVALPDGSRFVVHPLDVEKERSAIGATLVGAEGAPQRFQASQWFFPGLDKDLPAPGTAGQVYGAALLSDGRVLAISIGWANEAGQSRNALLILERSPSGGWVRRNLIIVPGSVRDLTAGPGNTLLVATFDATRSTEGTGPPLLTVVSTDGKVRGEFFPIARQTGNAIAARNAGRARIQRIGDARFSLFDDLSGTVRIFDLSVPPELRSKDAGPRGVRPGIAQFLETPDVSVGVRATVTLQTPRPPEAAGQPPVLQGVHVSGDGLIRIVRYLVRDRKPASTVTSYLPDGRVIETWSPAAPWRTVFWEHERLFGVATQKETTVLESVVLGKPE